MRSVENVRFYPTKDLFIDTITKDISIRDCIFDLIDNAVDSYVKNGIRSRREIKVAYTTNAFEITDTCGGINIQRLLNDVFRLGFVEPGLRRPTIGMYGIGLKRSIFKIGDRILFETDDRSDYARLILDIPRWRRDTETWDVPLDEHVTSNLKTGEKPYTHIKITGLHADTREAMTHHFFETLRGEISIYYTHFISEHLDIYLNGSKVEPYQVMINMPDGFEPASYFEKIDDLQIRIICWLEYEEGRAKFQRGKSGWNVFMNKRLILHDNVEPKTGWTGESGMLPKHHQLYNQFRGIVYIDCNDASKLPINTQKNGFNEESAAYINIRKRMVKAARPIINFLATKYSKKKEQADDYQLEIADYVKGQSREKSTSPIRIGDIPPNQEFRHPKLLVGRKTQFIQISYQRPRRKVDKLKRCFGVKSNVKVGEASFDHSYSELVGNDDE